MLNVDRILETGMMLDVGRMLDADEMLKIDKMFGTDRMLDVDSLPWKRGSTSIGSGLALSPRLPIWNTNVVCDFQCSKLTGFENTLLKISEATVPHVPRRFIQNLPAAWIY